MPLGEGCRHANIQEVGEHVQIQGRESVHEDALEKWL